MMNITSKPTLKLIEELPAAIGAISSVKISPDSRWIASGGHSPSNKHNRSQQYSWSLNLYDRSQKNLNKLDLAEINDWQPHYEGILSINFTPDSRKILVGSAINPSPFTTNLSCWNIGRNPIDFIATTTTDPSFLTATIVHPDGKTIFVTGNSYGLDMIQRYSIDDLKLIQQWLSRNDQMSTCNTIQAFAISANGQYLYAAGDKGIQHWDTNFGWKEPMIFKGPGVCIGKELMKFGGYKKFGVGYNYGIRSLSLSQDNLILASGGYQRIKIWDARTGNLLQSFYGHADSISALAITPDSRFLISAGDYTIKFWDIVTGKKLNTITAHKSRIRSIALNSDGNILVSGADDGIVKIWQVN